MHGEEVVFHSAGWSMAKTFCSPATNPFIACSPDPATPDLALCGRTPCLSRLGSLSSKPGIVPGGLPRRRPGDARAQMLWFERVMLKAGMNRIDHRTP